MWTKGRRGAALAVAGAWVMALALAACGGGEPAGGGSGLRPFTLAMSQADGVQASVLLAAARGYYRDEGLDVSIGTVGSNVVNAVVASQADIGALGAGGALLPVRDGRDVVVVGNFTAVKGVFLGAKDVARVADCKRMGTQTPGTSTYGWTTLYGQAFGANYQVVNFQDYPTIQAAIKSGNVDCATLNYPAALPLVNDGSGIHIIADPSSADFPPVLKQQMNGYIGGALFGVATNLDAKRADVQAFLRAVAKASGDMGRDDPAKLAADLTNGAPQFAGFDQKALASGIAYEQKVGSYMPDGGVVTETGWANTLSFQKNAGLDFIEPGDPKWSFQQRVNMSFLRP